MRYPAPFRASVEQSGMYSTRAWTVEDVLQVAKYKGFFAMSAGRYGEPQLNSRYIWADDSAKFLMEKLGQTYRLTIEGQTA